MSATSGSPATIDPGRIEPFGRLQLLGRPPCSGALTGPGRGATVSRRAPPRRGETACRDGTVSERGLRRERSPGREIGHGLLDLQLFLLEAGEEGVIRVRAPVFLRDAVVEPGMAGLKCFEMRLVHSLLLRVGVRLPKETHSRPLVSHQLSRHPINTRLCATTRKGTGAAGQEGQSDERCG